MRARRQFAMIGGAVAAAITLAVAVFPIGGTEPASLAGLEGVWRSRGYGWIWSVDEDGITAYDHTASFCTRRSRNDIPRDIMERMRPGESGQTFRVAIYDPSYSFTFDRIAGLPDHCTGDPDTDPLSIFQMVAEIFSEHYAFFEERKVDWPTLVSKYSPQVTSETSDAELFGVLAKLIAPFDDVHVSLGGEVAGHYETYEPPAKARKASALAREREGRIGYWTTGIGPKLVTGRLYEASEGVRYGLIGKDIGYIQIDSIVGGLRDAAESGMDHARDLFQNAKALIVDLTGNDGGHDLIARKFASLLTVKRVVGYYKYPGDAKDESPQPVYVEPGEEPLFTGPVFLITDRKTISAAEILTMCLRALPNVIHAGETTQGSLSDELVKQLPNGWVFNLSNEVYLDSEREAWEGKGIPPQIEFMVHDKETAPGDPEEAARGMIGYLLREARKS